MRLRSSSEMVSRISPGYALGFRAGESATGSSGEVAQRPVTAPPAPRARTLQRVKSSSVERRPELLRGSQQALMIRRAWAKELIVWLREQSPLPRELTSHLRERTS